MATELRWGIVGTGMIAGTFARQLPNTGTGVAAAVGSRSSETAASFAGTHGIPTAHGSYADLLADPGVDAVYVATPHPCHRDVVLAAAAAGKHILCEKPMGVTPGECREMITAADEAGVVLLEAFMYRTHPQTLKLQELISQGTIGEVRIVRSTFCFGLGNAYNVRLDPSLRGGGLYDVGCYCINFSRMVAGEEPDRVQASWYLGPDTGVDEHLAATLLFPSGALATFDVGVRSAGSAYAEIAGSEGSLRLDQPWKPGADSAQIQLSLKGKGTETVTIENGGNVFALEADHLADVVAGRAEPLIPASNAIGNAAVMDAIWQQMHG